MHHAINVIEIRLIHRFIFKLNEHIKRGVLNKNSDFYLQALLEKYVIQFCFSRKCFDKD